jgi:hypothetical protein
MRTKIGPTKWSPAVFLKKRGTDLSAVNRIANQKELEGARLSVPVFQKDLYCPFSKFPGQLSLRRPPRRCLYGVTFNRAVTNSSL